MVDLIIALTRYLFVFYMIYFLWQGLVYLIDERNIQIKAIPATFLEGTSMDIAIIKQRYTIVFMHITAFLILSIGKSFLDINIEALIIGGLGLIFLMFVILVVPQIYKNSCKLMFNSVFFLMDIGLIVLTRISPSTAKRQLMWFLVGIIVMLIIPLGIKLIPKFEKLEKLYLLLALLLIISPFVFGLRKNGSVNWIDIGSVKFQPSEVVKFLYIFYIASRFRKKVTTKSLIFPTLATGFLILVLVAQKDLGGALIFFMTYMVIVYIVTGNLLILALGIGFASLGSVVAFHLFSHIRVRVEAFLDPLKVIDSGGYQIMQSQFAIGTGGIFGTGLTKGHPTLIPVVTSDFIFAAICEEFGIVFSIGVVLVFAIIFYRGVHIALRCKRKYYFLLAGGFTSILAFQSFLILGGVINLIPLTGVTLPLISYGGSSVVVCMLMIGIIEWVYIYNFKLGVFAETENIIEE